MIKFDSTLREFLRQGNTVISNLVLKNYKKLGMTDTEFILYLQLNSYLQKGETFPELENIAKSLQISVNDVYTQLHNLIEKKILKIETIVNQQGQKTDSYSFDFLYQKLDSLIDEEKKELLNVSAEKDRQKIFNAFQVEFGRDLSPIELETINDWIEEDKYKTDLILLALREAVLSQAYSLKYIDRILLSWEKQGIRSKVDVENLKKAREKKKENINTISNNNRNKENKPKIPLTKWLD